MQKYWPIIMVVTANVAYNISAKQTPEDINPFFALVVTYGIAMLASLLLFLVNRGGTTLLAELGKTNWATYLFGFCVVALEFGYLNIYRVGWPIHTASLVANISLAVILLFVGIAIFRESISLRQIAGIAVCALGFVLISGK